MQREGFKEAPDLDNTVFTIESDNKGNLLAVFGEVCDAIDSTLQEGEGEGEGLLMWDIGGGVAAVAAYRECRIAYALKSFVGHPIDRSSITVMKKHAISLPEAMMTITRARLKRAKPTNLPSKRIIEMLNNKNYLLQLEMWRACHYNLFENTIVNPTDPRERWMVEKVREIPHKKKAEVALPILKGMHKKLSNMTHKPHRLSTIVEVEEEAQRLSLISGEHADSDGTVLDTSSNS